AVAHLLQARLPIMLVIGLASLPGRRAVCGCRSEECWSPGRVLVLEISILGLVQAELLIPLEVLEYLELIVSQPLELS
ncbi:unnamed protein product, partial [Prorocentrum cordatum]